MTCNERSFGHEMKRLTNEKIKIMAWLAKTKQLKTTWRALLIYLIVGQFHLSMTFASAQKCLKGR
ncbi:CLUMA_CG019270, isoform A [Clunio marinus]|uniref:CLUMA_CG019270, isoform A n=1 Tax=Clunio marinus TaxID=568069 RepID=A0A1J1J217_9DIPT|nr:CLUMA_CG019270, isoform A [Clunio marinus]